MSAVAPTGEVQGGVGPEAARSAAPAPAALPCLNNNNSTSPPQRRYKFKHYFNCGDTHLKQDRDGRYWDQDDGPDHTAQLVRFGRLNSTEAKSAFVLRGQVSDFFHYWGREQCAFFTLTDNACRHPTEFNHCFDSWKTHHGHWIEGYIRVLEPQRRGAPHYHLLVSVKWDMQPDRFDWEALERSKIGRADKDWAKSKCNRAQYVASVPPETYQIWKLCRKTLPKYQLGRAEFLPIRKNEEAVSQYIGQYLEGGLRIRLHDWKGCRRVERDRRTAHLWNRHHRQFSWVSEGAATWRKRLGELASAFDILHFDGFKKRFGPRWAYRLRERLLLANEEDWREFLTLLKVSQSTRSPLTSFDVIHNVTLT